MAATRTIPRFLLPQTSWTQATNAYRVPSSAILRYQNTQTDARRPFSSSTTDSGTLNQGRVNVSQSVGRDAIRQARARQQESRQFSTTARRAKDHHFDTLKFVQRLQDEGFSEEQAVAMMKVLGDVVEERSVCRADLATAEGADKLCTVSRT